jgi:pimeloyl-ACP methyl ester carboxylesterase
VRRMVCGLALAAIWTAPVLTSDLDKEKRWAEQIVDSLIDGEPEWLGAGGNRFLAIYTESAPQDAEGAVILLHGIGVHPDWPQVIHRLRVDLPEGGWSTLSVQMPVLPNEAEVSEYAPLFDEVAPRLDASVAFLRGKGVEDIAIVGHSLGASMGSHYLASGERPIGAFVGVGMPKSASDPRMDNVRSLAKIEIPVLDLYGSDDSGAIQGAPQRAEVAKATGNTDYRRVEVNGADHFFDGSEEKLVETVTGWLDETFSGR